MRHRLPLILASLIALGAPLAVAMDTAGAAPSQDPQVPANCDDYTPGVITVRPTSVDPGESVVVQGTGEPNATIEVTLRPPAGAAGGIVGPITTTVGADGQWSATVAVPADGGAGAWIITAVDVQCQVETTAEVRVLGDDAVARPNTPAGPARTSQPSAAPVGNLAVTGTALHIPVSIGFALLTVGGLILLSRGRDDHLTGRSA